MSDRFEMVELPETNSGKNLPAANNKIVDALADNMDSILGIAKDIVAIERMKVQSEAVLKQMEEDRARLREEAKAYVMKKNADTKDAIDKMQMARILLNEFYNQKSTAGVSAEEFSTVIKSIYGISD